VPPGNEGGQRREDYQVTGTMLALRFTSLIWPSALLPTVSTAATRSRRTILGGSYFTVFPPVLRDPADHSPRHDAANPTSLAPNVRSETVSEADFAHPHERLARDPSASGLTASSDEVARALSLMTIAS
jgi:hypothetical protein